MKPDVIREINGVDYRFRMSLRASIDIEHDLGTPLTELKDNPNISQINMIISRTIRDGYGKKLTPEDWEIVEDLVSITDAADIIKEVMGVSLPEKTSNQEADTKNE